MRKIITIVMALAFALCLPAMAFAVNGDGTGGGGGKGSGGGTGSGDGSGGGSGEPLVVTSASIESGAQIGAGDSITLVFSKNVCDAGVRESNKALVSVQDAQGSDVPAVVTLADDQVEPDKKNDIVVGFESAPAEGAYTLTAKAGITSKSGDALAEDYVLEFTVAGETPANAASTESASSSAESASASAASASASGASSASASASSSGNATTQQNGPDMTMIAILGVVIVVIVVGAVVIVRKRK